MTKLPGLGGGRARGKGVWLEKSSRSDTCGDGDISYLDCINCKYTIFFTLRTVSWLCFGI